MRYETSYLFSLFPIDLNNLELFPTCHFGFNWIFVAVTDLPNTHKVPWLQISDFEWRMVLSHYTIQSFTPAQLKSVCYVMKSYGATFVRNVGSFKYLRALHIFLWHVLPHIALRIFTSVYFTLGESQQSR